MRKLQSRQVNTQAKVLRNRGIRDQTTANYQYEKDQRDRSFLLVTVFVTLTGNFGAFAKSTVGASFLGKAAPKTLNKNRLTLSPWVRPLAAIPRFSVRAATAEMQREGKV